MESYPSTVLQVAVACLVVLLVFVLRRSGHDTRVYPPGPPRRLLVGNLRDIPSGGYEWESYREIAKKCGSDVVYLTALGTKLLVLSSFEAARDLLDRKGAIYSSRPRLVMINELMGWDWSLILMPYGRPFQAYRKTIQQEFQHSVVASSYRPIIVKESLSLVSRLSQTPADLSKHLKQMAGAVIMMVTYGHQVTSAEDEFVALAEAVRENDEKTPGSNLVDVIPVLKYVPAWFPGAGFKRAALYARKLAWDMRYVPFQAVKAHIASGTCRDSVVSRLLQSDSPLDDVDKDEFAMNSGGVVYSGGLHLSWGRYAALLNFFLAMTWYPEVQQRGQKELDEVVGRDRLPTFEDRDRLPYISNIVKETLRWKAASPLALPPPTVSPTHPLRMIRTEGCTYPRGQQLSPTYPPCSTMKRCTRIRLSSSPSDMKQGPGHQPENRTLHVLRSASVGGAICPGRFFADESVWLTVALALHVFDILNPEGAPSKVEWCSGLVSLPSDFPCMLSPRFPSAVDLVSSAEM
ncbi:cytochrome P450 [Ganoderma sinense ZZ0214-1]|uniref:Cytochrome P450 n=1 Tax=Ganoderma sinense ZZ0214-1 TaxID=1077348 RepID=A0A2G8RSW4_9APHY|nr:cytochrome P450 [Ganoderma sinense ZZ0214-1]